MEEKEKIKNEEIKKEEVVEMEKNEVKKEEIKEKIKEVLADVLDEYKHRLEYVVDVDDEDTLQLIEDKNNVYVHSVLSNKFKTDLCFSVEDTEEEIEYKLGELEEQLSRFVDKHTKIEELDWGDEYAEDDLNYNAGPHSELENEITDMVYSYFDDEEYDVELEFDGDGHKYYAIIQIKRKTDEEYFKSKLVYVVQDPLSPSRWIVLEEEEVEEQFEKLIKKHEEWEKKQDMENKIAAMVDSYVKEDEDYEEYEVIYDEGGRKYYAQITIKRKDDEEDFKFEIVYALQDPLSPSWWIVLKEEEVKKQFEELIKKYEEWKKSKTKITN